MQDQKQKQQNERRGESQREHDALPTVGAK